jgi:hypothetical protein
MPEHSRSRLSLGLLSLLGWLRRNPFTALMKTPAYETKELVELSLMMKRIRPSESLRRCRPTQSLFGQVSPWWKPLRGRIESVPAKRPVDFDDADALVGTRSHVNRGGTFAGHIRCGASDGIRIPARPAQYVHRRVPDRRPRKEA